jgi:non-heme chloroperoxidase
MPYVTVGKENGANIDIYFKDWGKGHPIIVRDGWLLSTDVFEDQMSLSERRDEEQA